MDSRPPPACAEKDVFEVTAIETQGSAVDPGAK